MDDSAKWRGWRQAHQQALDGLQAALATYHRLTAEQAFGRDDEEARLRRVDALARPEELRRRLDQVCEQRPLDFARGEPLDFARGKPLDFARGKPSEGSHD